MKTARAACPVCGSRQFSVRLDAQNRPVKPRCYYNRCSPAAILAALRGTPLDQLRLTPTQDPGRNRAAAQRTWNFSQAVERTLAERYLRDRSITIKPPACLKFNANVFHHRNSSTDFYFPALIACAETSDGRFAGIHRTWLDPTTPDLKLGLDPKKASLGTAPGSVVRLTPTLSDTVVLTEGIEDGLSLVQATKLTVWCTLGTNIRAVQLLDCVRTVILAGDNDRTGQTAIQAAAKHFHANGRQVRIVYPPPGIKDFNDSLRVNS